ncbi:MAG TPA: hypothetical protein VD932_03665 [Aquabacterium sp.]|nr:hypothetical protein [Aquabacterium sp.]
MTDILLPSWLNISRVAFSAVDNVGVSPSLFGGTTRTAALSSGRLRASMEFTSVGGASTQVERGALIGFLARAGKRNRVYLYDPSQRIRGSIPVVELISNNTFASGTTGFSNSGTACVLSASDRLLRATRTSSTTGPRVQATATVTPLVPYAARAMMLLGRGSPTLQTSASDGTITTQSVAGAGLSTTVIVPVGTSLSVAVVDTAIGLAGDYFAVSYFSLSRCALVDAGVNRLLRSDEFNDAVWQKAKLTVTANESTSPDGNATGDFLREDTTNGEHFVQQAITGLSSAPADYCFGVAVRPNGRNFCLVGMAETSGNTLCEQFFNLSTGAVGVTGTTGTGWASRRAFTRDLGNGWIACYVIGRKLVGTSVNAYVQTATADNVGADVYTGDGASGIRVWRATFSPSSVPMRLKQTTSSISSGEEQRGGALQLKGLLPSTSGLLLPGDLAEVIGGRGSELKIVAAPLNSDSAGLGYLEIEPSIRSSPADNAAVIFQQPMGRFIFDGDVPSWSTDPGIITTASAEFIEA